jgi:hypothetical protein
LQGLGRKISLGLAAMKRNDVVASAYQTLDDVGPDESRTANDQDPHDVYLLEEFQAASSVPDITLIVSRFGGI